jgi:hypothetical protein
LLAILERGNPVPVVTRHDMRLVADALADQSRMLAARARSKAYAGTGKAIARAVLRERAERLAELSSELGPHDGLLLVAEAAR